MTDSLPEPPRVDPAVVQAWRDRQLKNLPKDKLSMAEQITAANRLAALFDNPQTLTGGLTKTGAGGANVQVALDKPYKGLSTISAVAATGCDRFGRVTMLRDKNNDWYAFGGGTEKLRSDRDKERSGDDKLGDANPIKYLFSTILTTDGVRDRVFYVGGHQANPEEVFRLPVAMQFASATLNNVGSDGAVINVKLGDRLQCWDMAEKRWELKVVGDVLYDLTSRGYGFWAGTVEDRDTVSISGDTTSVFNEQKYQWVSQTAPTTAKLFDSGWLNTGTNVQTNTEVYIPLGLGSYSVENTGNFHNQGSSEFRFFPDKSVVYTTYEATGNSHSFLRVLYYPTLENLRTSLSNQSNNNTYTTPFGMTNEAGTASLAGLTEYSRIEKYSSFSNTAIGLSESSSNSSTTRSGKARHAWVSTAGVSLYPPEGTDFGGNYTYTETDGVNGDRTAEAAFFSKSTGRVQGLASLDVFTPATMGDWTSNPSAIDCFDDSFAASYLKRFWQKNADGSIKSPNKEITKDNEWTKTEDLETFPMEVETFTKEFKSDGKEDREVYVIPEDVLPQDKNPLATPQALSAIAPIPDIYRKVTSLNKYFLYEPSSTTTADSITVIRPSSIASNQPGRWLESARYVVYAYSYFPPN